MSTLAQSNGPNPQTPGTRAIAQSESQKFLRFCLGKQDNTLLAVLPIVEITPLRVQEILPVPQMPSYILGIHNWRGAMLWLVDLGHLVGLSPLFEDRSRTDLAMAIVVQEDDRMLGLVVDRVAEIEQYHPSQIQPPDAQLFPANLLPYLQGFFIQDQQDVLTVLDVSAIFQVPQWRSLM
jgi:positive phototaxis protein PixI